MVYEREIAHKLISRYRWFLNSQILLCALVSWITLIPTIDLFELTSAIESEAKHRDKKWQTNVGFRELQLAPLVYRNNSPITIEDVISDRLSIKNTDEYECVKKYRRAAKQDPSSVNISEKSDFQAISQALFESEFWTCIKRADLQQVNRGFPVLTLERASKELMEALPSFTTFGDLSLPSIEFEGNRIERIELSSDLLLARAELTSEFSHRLKEIYKQKKHPISTQVIENYERARPYFYAIALCENTSLDDFDDFLYLFKVTLNSLDVAISDRRLRGNLGSQMTLFSMEGTNRGDAIYEDPKRVFLSSSQNKKLIQKITTDFGISNKVTLNHAQDVLSEKVQIGSIPIRLPANIASIAIPGLIFLASLAMLGTLGVIDRALAAIPRNGYPNQAPILTDWMLLMPNWIGALLSSISLTIPVITMLVVAIKGNVNDLPTSLLCIIALIPQTILILQSFLLRRRLLRSVILPGN